MSPDRRNLLTALLSAPFGLGAHCAWANTNYPSRPLNVIVPWPAGGPTDFYARLYEEPWRRRLQQPLIIENIAGVSGALGVKRVLDAAPDGHTLGLLANGELVLAPLGLATVKHRPEDLRVAAMLGSSTLVLLTRPGLPLTTLDQVADGARQAQLTYAHTGNGSLYHLAAERLAQVSGLRLTGVPYKGIAQIFTDLGGGHVDMALLPLAGQVVGMVQQGRFKAIAHTSRDRHPMLPDLPAMPSHPKLRDMEFYSWLSLAVRRDTPEAMVARLNAVTNEVLQEPAVQKASAETGGIQAPPRTLAENERIYQAEIARFRAIAQSIKLQPQ
jgi:tripartite-type tricarboxylate transporter receptor subunit TctC